VRHGRGSVLAAAGVLMIAGGLVTVVVATSGGGSAGTSGPGAHVPGLWPVLAGGTPSRLPTPSRSARARAKARRSHPKAAPATSPGASATALPPGAAGTSSPRATLPAPTRPDLQAALLTAGELPGGGFTTQAGSAGTGLGSLSACPELSAGESGGTPEDVSFIRAATASAVSETLIQDSVTGAEAQISQFAQVARACGSFSATVSGYAMDVTIASEAFPATGDGTAALRLSARLAAYGVTVTGDIVAVRHGGTVIVVSNVDYPLDSGLTRAVVGLAYAKVAARW
jgi:hypothetical protein